MPTSTRIRRRGPGSEWLGCAGARTIVTRVDAVLGVDGHPHRPRRHGRAAGLGPRDADAARWGRVAGAAAGDHRRPAPPRAGPRRRGRGDRRAARGRRRARRRRPGDAAPGRARPRPGRARARGAGARDHRGLLALRVDLDRGAEGRRLRGLRPAAADRRRAQAPPGRGHRGRRRALRRPARRVRARRPRRRAGAGLRRPARAADPAGRRRLAAGGGRAAAAGVVGGAPDGPRPRHRGAGGLRRRPPG